MLTATQLLAVACGFALRAGHRRCFFCGGKCDESTPASEIVKDSFTARDTVAGGSWVCDGCVVAMDERASVTLIDGEIREGQKRRCYSWVITKTEACAASKSHRQQLTSQCLLPPDPPFVICISDSGQKHLLYRAVVNHDRSIVTVTLEGERVVFSPGDLTTRLVLCRQICAATGKPALTEAMSTQTQMRVCEHYESEQPLLDWLAVQQEPLTRLAAWLCPPKEECLHEFPWVIRHTEPAREP